MAERHPLRVVVVEDSAQNRRAIQDIISRAPGVEVVAVSGDGEDALRQVLRLRPDLVTLDLQMPRMDGFTLLRILMSRAPTPVIVVSSQSAKENVFKALELGALDFVAKPAPGRSFDEVADQILEKIGLIRQLERQPAVRAARPIGSRPGMPAVDPCPGETPLLAERPRRIVAVAASTGGPAAIGDLLDRVPSGFPGAFVIVQHMPEKFTKTFAERLDRRSSLRVREATDGDLIAAGTAWVAPGQRCMEVVEREGRLQLVVRLPTAADRYVPSADRLFESASTAVGPDLLAVVLTGMGDDGREGVQAVKSRGGRVVVEAPDTAIVFGMPGAALRTGCVDAVIPMGEMLAAIEGFLVE